MRHIASIIDHSLIWNQPKVFSNSYELRFGDELIASMTFPKNFSSRATVHTADGDWSYERVGVFRHKVLIRPEQSDTILAEYVPKSWTGSGTIELPEGKRVLYRASAFRGTSMFLNEGEEELFRYDPQGFFRPTITLTFNRRASQIQHLPMLVLLGFYLIVMAQRDSAAAAAA